MVDSLGRCGESCSLTLLRVRFTWQVWGMVRPSAWPGIVFRGRRRGSCAAHEAAGFRGPVREIACVGVSG